MTDEPRASGVSFFRRGVWLGTMVVQRVASRRRCGKVSASPAWWQIGYAPDCKSVEMGSIPVQASIDTAGLIPHE